MKLRHFLIGFITALVSVHSLVLALTLPHVFGDHMVLQTGHDLCNNYVGPKTARLKCKSTEI